jgi:hypothetical protein
MCDDDQIVLARNSIDTKQGIEETNAVAGLVGKGHLDWDQAVKEPSAHV